MARKNPRNQRLAAFFLAALGVALTPLWWQPAQALVPLEYSGFLWAALFGWLFFAEGLELPVLAGAVLIVAGCWIAAPRKRPEQTAT